MLDIVPTNTGASARDQFVVAFLRHRLEAQRIAGTPPLLVPRDWAVADRAARAIFDEFEAA